MEKKIEEITLRQFVDKYSKQAGPSFLPQIEIICAYPFEFNCHESWNTAYSIRFLNGNFAGKVFKWYESLSEADKAIQAEADKAIQETLYDHPF
jgi:hypothetical protein